MDSITLSCLTNFSTNPFLFSSSFKSIKPCNPCFLPCRCNSKAISAISYNLYTSNTKNYGPGKSSSSIPGNYYLLKEFCPSTKRKRGVIVRANFRFDSGSGGGGGGGNNEVGRVVFNLALAGCLTYLTVTGKLGWVVDAIVSLWLLAALVPLAGAVAFLWFAGREMVQGTCPNCGNGFQVFESAIKDGPQLCPYCSQPFKLENKEFVRESPSFSKQRFGGFKQTFDGFSYEPKKQEPSVMVVDVEAEVKDKD